MNKFFALLMVVFSLTVAETALAGDWGRGRGDHHGWSRPHYDGGRGNHHGGYHGGRHHGGGGKNDFLYGVLAGTIAGVIIAQPPPAYYPPQPVYQVPPQRCWTEWRPAYGLYDRYGNQLGQNVTVCR